MPAHSMSGHAAIPRPALTRMPLTRVVRNATGQAKNNTDPETT